jgi:hypothetical protein
MMETLSLRVEAGALVEAPVWESRRGGRNWLAVIAANPRSPGGLDRRFMERGRGEYLYLLDRVRPGQPVEFGADLGHQRIRWYGVVVSLSDEALVLEHHRTARSACAAASVLAPPPSERQHYPSLAERLAQLKKELEGEHDTGEV